MNQTLLKNSIGWVGVGCVLAAFMLTTFEVISAKDLWYGVLNSAGAVGIIISSLAKKDLQPVALNVVWLVVAIIGIIRTLFSVS